MIALDTETTGVNVRKDRVIGFSYYDGTEKKYIVHLKWDGEKLVEVVRKSECVKILESFSDIIMHNAPFDILIIKNYFGVDLTDKVVADTMVMAHLYYENFMSYGLKQLGKNILGINPDEQTELKQWLKDNKTKDFYKVPHSILEKYAIQDVILTYNLYKFLLGKINFTLFEEELMPTLLLVVIPMMDRGIKIDLEGIKKDQLEIQKDITTLEDEIQDEIDPLLVEFKDEFYNKNFPLKSRGTVRNLLNHTNDLRLAQRLAFGGKYEFNLNSKDHLRYLFFDKLGYKPLSYTDGGKGQVDNTFLSQCEHPVSKKLITYNKLIKIKSTYIDRFIEEQEDGTFYPKYFLTRTTSGRLSGDMQQLPRPLETDDKIAQYTNKIRAYFISRLGYVFIDTDYNSLEPRVFCSVSGDENLKIIFKDNLDFYSHIAIMVEGLKDVSAKKDAENFLGKVNKSARQKAKAYSLGIAYGLNEYKLHMDLKISKEEATSLIRGYFNAFPKLKQWMTETRESILKKGEISTKFGRKKRALDIPTLYNKHGKAILNALELWKKYNADEPNKIKYNAAKKDYRTVHEAINNAYNHQIQGLAAHIMNRAAIQISKKIKPFDAHIIAQVHDQLVVECPIEVKHEVAKIIEEAMEKTTVLEGVDLIAKPEFGFNLRDGH